MTRVTQLHFKGWIHPVPMIQNKNECTPEDFPYSYIK